MFFKEPSKLFDKRKQFQTKWSCFWLILRYSPPIECHFNHYLAKQRFELAELSRWLHHLSWTAVSNYFPSASFIFEIFSTTFTNGLFCSKVGIIRNELLFLWILSICKLWRPTHKLHIKPFGLYTVCD